MRMHVNGRLHEVDAAPTASLLEVLRERLGLTGTKVACARGECGVCSVLLDGELVYSCLTLAQACDDGAVTTVEGLAPPGMLAPLQRAFIALDATQCGFCTPGQLIAAHALLAARPHPSDAEILEAMSGNLCRCGTYPKIVAAIRAVSEGEFADGEPAQRGSDAT
jgi:xanthine dehydrogenase YagT iron-sulfur-binding subunit